MTKSLRSLAARAAAAPLALTGAVPRRRLRRRGQPVPLREVIRVRRRLPGKNPLAPSAASVRASAASLSDPRLAEALAGEELGVWSIGPQTIDILKDHVTSNRPQAILEFGCGVSTTCLAYWMREIHSAPAGRVIAIEQDPAHADRTRRRLHDLGLGATAIIHERSVVDQVAGGRSTTCYDLHDLRDLLSTHEFQMVLIDGPSGPPPDVRWATVPLVLESISNQVTFFLDDALRDAELSMARDWEGLERVRTRGIFVFETGILSGTIEPG